MSARVQILLLTGLLGLVALATSVTLRGAELRRRIEHEGQSVARAALDRAVPVLEAVPDARLEAADLGSLPAAALVALVDARGVVVAARPASLVGRSAESLPVAEAATRLDEVRSRGRTEATRSGVIVNGRAVRGPGFRDPSIGPPLPPDLPFGARALIVQLDTSAALAAGWNGVVREHALAVPWWLGLMGLLWVALERRLARPARRVASAARELAAGDRSARAGLQGRGEIEAVGHALDALAARLETGDTTLRDAHRMLEAAFDALPWGVVVVRREDGRPLHANPAWHRIHGQLPDPRRDILSHLSAVRCERPDGSARLVEEHPIPIVLRTGQPAESRDSTLRRADGSTIRVIARAFPLRIEVTEGFDAVLSLVEECAPADVEHAAAAEASGEPLGFEPSGGSPTGTVLIVEDEPELLERASRSLAAEGHRVLGAVDGEEALAIVRRGVGVIDAVVLDLTLPGKSGREVLEELLTVDPAAQVILASGYHPDVKALLGSGLAAAILAKPYSTQRLLAAVRGVVRRGRVGLAGAARA